MIGLLIIVQGVIKFNWGIKKRLLGVSGCVGGELSKEWQKTSKRREMTC